MENYEQNQGNSNFLTQMPLPNATASLVLGILSIVFFCCFSGGISIILGIIGVALGFQATNLYTRNHELFSESSYKNASAGKICSIIGLVIGLFMLAMLIANWSFYMEMIEQIKDGSFDPNMFY
jgi:di/tricarboxylate transporter